MHEIHQRMPFEYYAIAFMTGWLWVVIAIGVLFVIAWIREMVFRPIDKRDAAKGERPFMTPALRESLQNFPFR